jgi:hypothetical protein
LVYRLGKAHSGIWHFRLSSTLRELVEARLLEVVARQSDEFKDFLVVTDQRVRVRR